MHRAKKRGIERHSIPFKRSTTAKERQGCRFLFPCIVVEVCATATYENPRVTHTWRVTANASDLLNIRNRYPNSNEHGTPRGHRPRFTIVVDQPSAEEIPAACWLKTYTTMWVDGRKSTRESHEFAVEEFWESFGLRIRGTRILTVVEYTNSLYVELWEALVLRIRCTGNSWRRWFYELVATRTMGVTDFTNL